MAEKEKKIAIGCMIDREIYDWLQAVRGKLQKNNVGNVSLAAVIKNVLKRAKEDKLYGEVDV